MNIDAWFTIAVIVCMIAVMVLELAKPHLVLLGAVTALLAFGVIDAKEAFIGLSNSAVITIAALFVIAAAIRETGALDWVGRAIFGMPRSLPGGQLRMMFPVAAFSAFINNTPVVAIFQPIVSNWARRCNLSISMLLMPLSYAAILGGTCTLIGTSTNLVVAGMAKSVRPDISFPLMEMAWIGLPLMTIGIFYVVVASQWLLKDRKGTIQTLGQPREYTIRMRIEKGSPVIGKSIEKAGLRSLPNLYLYEVEHQGQILAAVSPSTILHEGDRLHFAGVIDSMIDLRKLRIEPDNDQIEKIDGAPVRMLVEGVLAAQSSLAGLSVKESRFRTSYNAAILAVHRQGVRIAEKKVGDIVLEAGDVLLLETHSGFVKDHQHDPNFALISAIEDSAPPRYDRAWLAVAVLATIVVANAFGLIDLMIGSLIAASLLVITGCISSQDAEKSIDYSVLVAIGAAFGISAAFENSGAAKHLADILVHLTAPLGKVAVLFVLYYATTLLSGTVTTKAAAALMFPITMNVAKLEGFPMVPMCYLVMIGAATEFATPIGYQTNLMVYGPGGYKYTDFLRLGIPLNIIAGIVTVTMIYLHWLS